MGRPRRQQEPRVSTQIRLPVSLSDRLREAAEDREVSVNRLVTKAVEDYLDHLQPSDVVLSVRRETLLHQAAG